MSGRFEFEENELLLKETNESLRHSSPREVLAWAYKRFGPGVAMATGFGQSGLVLTHIVSGLETDIELFYLDTGLLFDRCNLHQVIIHGNHISYCKRAGIRQLDGDVHNIQITGNASTSHGVQIAGNGLVGVIV